MVRLAATVVGAILLVGGVGVAVAHYLMETSGAMKFVTLAIAAVLLVAGLALLNWGRGGSRRSGTDGSEGGGSGFSPGDDDS